jgi:hypothetical protein
VPDTLNVEAFQENPPATRKKVAALTPAKLSTARFRDLLTNTRPGGFVDSAIHAAGLKDQLPLEVVAAVSEPALKSPDTKPNPRVAQLVRGFTTEPVSSIVLGIQLTWDDKDECERLLNAFRAEFMKQTAQYRVAQYIERHMFLKESIKRVERELQNNAARTESRANAAAAAAAGDPLVRRVRQEALQQHLKQLYLQEMQWNLHTHAVQVSASGTLVIQNDVTAEPIVTPRRMLAEAPGRLLRCTLLSFVLVLAGAALRHTVQLRRQRRFQRTVAGR